ncbi:hypothetical protein A2U01_0066443, partial [Trifolium medium]|nr:hypothetical protein [Trifolium medium]
DYEASGTTPRRYEPQVPSKLYNKTAV